MNMRFLRSTEGKTRGSHVSDYEEAIFWHVTYNLVKVHLHVGGTHFLHGSKSKPSKQVCVVENSNIYILSDSQATIKALAKRQTTSKLV
jgi:hypothetical protein